MPPSEPPEPPKPPDPWHSTMTDWANPLLPLPPEPPEPPSESVPSCVTIGQKGKRWVFSKEEVAENHHVLRDLAKNPAPSSLPKPPSPSESPPSCEMIRHKGKSRSRESSEEEKAKLRSTKPPSLDPSLLPLPSDPSSHGMVEPPLPPVAEGEEGNEKQMKERAEMELEKSGHLFDLMGQAHFFEKWKWAVKQVNSKVDSAECERRNVDGSQVSKKVELELEKTVQFLHLLGQAQTSSLNGFHDGKTRPYLMLNSGPQQMLKTDMVGQLSEEKKWALEDEKKLATIAFSRFSSQTWAVQNFLATAETKDVICNIQISLDEQKQQLPFSIHQQEEGFQQGLTSPQVVSEATVNFFNDIHLRSAKVQKIIEETQNERFHQLTNFEMKFKEEVAREEGQALGKIAAILAAFTSKRTDMVSEASRNMQDPSMEQSKRLQQEMLNMLQVSKDATKEVSEYVEYAKSHYVYDRGKKWRFEAEVVGIHKLDAIIGLIPKEMEARPFAFKQWDPGGRFLSCPILHLEDKAEFQGVGNDRTLDIGPMGESNLGLLVGLSHEGPMIESAEVAS